MVVASSGAAIRGAKAVPSDLSGPGKIPAAAVEILWGLPDRALMRRTRTPCFDTLDEIPPAEVPVDASGKGAVLPIWISVKVPADAKPGEYKGEVTVSSKGTQPVEVPVKLSVVDWRMPDGRDLSTFLDLVQSPDTLAMKYEVEPWSEEHWKLIGRSFELMGRLGVKTLWVPLIAKTHFGNAHSMVRWRKVPVPGARGQVPGTPGKPDTRDPAPGTWKHDFGIAERYVKTAVKHLGTVQLTCLYCWEPAKVGAHWHHGKDYGEREILFSLQNGSGKAEVIKGPDWGTPECEKFWRPVFDGMRRILKENGLEGTAMVGLCDDYEPSENSVRTLKAVAPEMKWVVHSHVSSWLLKGVRGRPVGYLACIWGIHGVHDPDDPALGNTARSYGWKHRVKLCTFPRGWPRPNSHPAMYRTYMERAVTAMGKYGSWKTEDGKPADGWSGTDGAGRMGADFWEVLKDKRGRVRGTLAGAYSYWGGLDLNRYSIPNVLGPGKKRPQATVRSELFRETIQENEIRFFLERALTDGKNRARLGEDLAARAQEILDERVRASLANAPAGSEDLDKWRWFVGSDAKDRSERLYRVGAEAAAKLGRK
jgi:hypothetical protein